MVKDSAIRYVHRHPLTQHMGWTESRATVVSTNAYQQAHLFCFLFFSHSGLTSFLDTKTFLKSSWHPVDKESAAALPTLRSGSRGSYPERLVRDEWEVRDCRLLFPPFSGDTRVSEELPVCEHSFEFDCHIGRGIFRVTAGQADGKAKKKVSLSWS